MQVYSPMTTSVRAQTIVRDSLKRAQSLFCDNPNSTHWVILTRAMIVYQQFSQLRGNDKAALLGHLDTIVVNEWPEAIVKHSTGLTIAEALA